MRVMPIKTTGQYMYMALNQEKLSHMNSPSKKMNNEVT